MKYSIRPIRRRASFCLFAAVLGTATLLGTTTQTQAQDAYHQWVLGMLEGYNIEGGQFVLGTNEVTKINNSAWIYDTVNPSASTAQTFNPEPDEEVPFTVFNRYTHPTVTANWYDSGTRWVGVQPVEFGDVALLVLLIRGESTSGNPVTVELVFDRNVEPFDRSLSVEKLLFGEWTLVMIPFEMAFTLDAGSANFGINFGLSSAVVDVAAPIVLNYKDKYSVAALEALIASGGEAPLIASFSMSANRGAAPFEVQFDAGNSSAPGSIVSYAWDFGDGHSGTGETTSHTYTELGTYTVTLTITDERNMTATVQREIIVFDGVGLPETPLEIPFADTPPIVDGDVDAAWEDAPIVSLSNVVAGFDPIDEADFSVTTRALWTAERLFVLYEVQDDALYNKNAETWRDDSVELYVDGGNERSTTYDENDGQYELGWDAEEVTGNAVAQGKAEGVEFASTTVSGGYHIEVSIPWSSLSVQVVPGDEIGIEFMANDNDSGVEQRQTKLSWFSLQDIAWSRLSDVATARLVGGEASVIAAKINIDPAEVMKDRPTTFDGSRSAAPGSITAYEWDFGDGTRASGATVAHTYRSTGFFEVSLTIQNDQGASSTATRTIEVIDGVGRPDVPFQIPIAAQKPVVDGVMDAVWSESANFVTLSHVPTGEPLTGDDDLAVTAYAMWDDDGIYVFVDVVDDVVVSNESEESWQDDAVEIFFDGDNAKMQDAYDENDGQFTVGIGDTELTGAKGRPGMGEGVQFASAETANGYAVEMAVPWPNLQTDPGVGVLIGFEVQVNDDDDGGERDSKMTWYDASDNAWRWAHVFATAVLVESVDVQSESGAQLPTAFSIESVYPNPFNPSATAVVAVRQTGDYELRIYNVLGQLLERHAVKAQMPGRMEVGLDFSARASGVYFISVEHRATGRVETTRALLVK